MGIPSHLLPHTVTRVRPAATTDAYGDEALDYGLAATRTNMAAWLQQGAGQGISTSEPRSDGRDPLVGIWLMLTNETDVDGRDHVEWTGPVGAIVFEVQGSPEPVYTPAGYHHLESTLRVVTG